MKTTDLRDLTDTALEERIATTRRDLFGLRMQHATGELDNTARIQTGQFLALLPDANLVAVCHLFLLLCHARL